MAPVEIGVFYKGAQDWKKEDSVPAGAYLIIDRLIPAELFVFCDRLDNHWRLLICGKADQLEVARYKDEVDEQGELIEDFSEPLVFSDSEIITVQPTSHDEVYSFTHVRSPGQAEEITSRKAIPAKV